MPEKKTIVPPAPEKKPLSQGEARAAKKRELAARRRKVSRMREAEFTIDEIHEELVQEAERNSRPAPSRTVIGEDVKWLQGIWHAAMVEAIGCQKERTLRRYRSDLKLYTSLRDERAKSKEDRAATRYGELIVKVQDKIAKLMGFDAPVKVEAAVQAAIQMRPFTDDLTKILADPKATEALLDAVQGAPEPRPEPPKETTT